MRLPFGLDLKSVVVGVVLAYFVIPFVMGKVSSLSSKSTNAA